MNRIEYNLTKKEETILTKKFESVMLLRQRQVNEILQKKNKNKYIILYIYIIEYMNRGGISTYIFEKCLCILMPKLIEYFDFSIGPFQMKYSFVKLYAPYSSLNEIFNIDYCIAILDNFFEENNDLNVYQKLSLYHSGEIDNEYRTTKIYINLYEWYKKTYMF